MKFPKLLLLVGIILGVLLGVISLPYNPIFKTQCEELLKKLFEEALHCTVSKGSLSHIDLCGIHLEGRQIHVIPKKSHDWYWLAEKLEIYSSWFDLLRTGKLNLELLFTELRAVSLMHNNQLAIYEHVQHIISSAGGLPIQLKKIQIQKGSISIHDLNNNMLRCNFNTDVQQIPHYFKSTVSIQDAELFLDEQRYVYVPETKARFEQQHNETIINGQSQFSLKNSVDTNNYFFEINWQNNQKAIALYSKDNKLAISTNSLAFTDTGFYAEIAGQFPVDILYQLGLTTFDQANGSCSITMNAYYDDKLTCNGVISSSDAAVFGKAIGNGDLSFSYRDSLWTGSLKSQLPLGSFQVNFDYNQQNSTGTVTCYNSSIIASADSYWKIYPKNCSAAASINKGVLQGNYQINILHDKLNELIPICGKLSFDSKSLLTQGSCNEQEYVIDCSIAPFSVNRCQLFDTAKASTVSIEKYGINQWLGTLSMSSLCALVHFITGYDIRADGNILCNAHNTNHGIELSVMLDKAIISLSPLYNVIHDLKATILLDFINKKIIAQNMQMNLHKGTISSKRASIGLDPISSQWFIHVPVIFNKLFLNKEKDLFAVVSGLLLVSDETRSPLNVSGAVWLDKGQINRNIFSAPSLQHVLTEFNHTLKSSNNYQCDITVESKKPFRIKTSFLTGDADFALKLHGSLMNPEITGFLSLQKGALAFPYKPLYLTHAKLFFGTPSLFDPVFELTAKNNIKKYAITLRGSGSLKNPFICFESTPPLQEEQIITLLLAGSEKDSIALAMPSIVMQNIQNIMFGPEQSELKLTSYFQRLLHPLKNIRIVPSFVDQTGRGGFRGALEIDLNDQLHALIQKNFSQPEDTKFEVEYAFSNDLILRGIKDEHGDLGGEVEMRWKF